MSYQEKAFKIVKESIKSAVFIDEKAREFYQDVKELTTDYEENLSIELYDNLKKNGISLDVHKYKISDENNNELKNYLFEDRDLVLLDWNLNGNSGAEFSLKLLEDIVGRAHIHFCIVYTSENGQNLDSVLFNILSYFSYENEEFYLDLKEKLESIENIETVLSELHNLNAYRDDVRARAITKSLFQEHREIIFKILEITGKEDIKCSLIKASIAFMKTLKSQTKNVCPSYVAFEEKTIVIDNTIIVVLNKNENHPNVLINNLSNQITKHENSFTQLLGLEMQTIFSKTSAFIDSNLLHFTKNALLFHRENYRKEGLLHFFPEFIKEIMIEKARLNIRNIPINLLESSFLDEEYSNQVPNNAELIAMNIFYNSTKLKNDNKLNFGDVFKRDGSEEYYICITALCDCLRPDKIQNSFFFAKGEPINTEVALSLGDSAFISYLSQSQIVKWTDVNTIIEQNNQKFSPVYIKPLQFTIVNVTFDGNDSIKFFNLNLIGEVENFNAKYITTIKSNYTQRIANHAFSYPIRVGVDFVKKQLL